MDKIKLKFVDFWSGFNPVDNYFTQILRGKYDIEISDTPDYIICSCFGHEALDYDCIRIFYSGENHRPDLNLYDYALGYDWFNCEDRYLRLPLYILYQNDFRRAMSKHYSSKEAAQSKTKFCNFIYSNGKNVNPIRQTFYELLNEYKKVDSGGRYLNNTGGPVADKYEFQKNYKFSIAFENTSTNGYTTEKIIQAWAAQTIPIYWGSPSVAKEFNSKAFVNCHSFDSLSDIMDYIRQIDQDDQLFRSILEEPIVTGATCAQIYTDDYVVDYFQTIFCQDYAKAFRRDIYGWGKTYEKRMKRMFEFSRYDPKNVVKSVKKTISSIIRP